MLRLTPDYANLTQMTEHSMTAAAAPLRGLSGRRVQIAGSASATVARERLEYAHHVARAVTGGIIREGGGIVVTLVPEPRLEDSPNAPALLFDWTVLQACLENISDATINYPPTAGLPIVVVCSELSESQIPSDRQQLWDDLLASGLLQVVRIRPGLRDGAVLREKQAEISDALLILGGGTGVEHAAELYLARERTVIPLDLRLGASREDGTGGGPRLYSEARTNPQAYLRLAPSRAPHAGRLLAQLSTAGRTVDADRIASLTVALMNDMDRPRAFYVRLLNEEHNSFTAVESFFREAVDPVVEALGYRRVEMGTDRSEDAFMNQEIFRQLHHASLVIVDITGERPNCFIELGYALGRRARVLVTAENGTMPPFDQQAIPTHFWRADQSASLQQQRFQSYWHNVIDRGPVVT